MKKSKIAIISLICLLLCSCGSSKSPEPVVLDFSNSENVGPVDTGDLNVHFGELLSVNQNGSTAVLKVKIEQSWNNELTINQNYTNVSDLIIQNGFNTCDEIQYFAVMDVGMEIKVISFTLDKQTIDGIYNDNIVDIQLGQFAKDLWIAPALLKEDLLYDH